MGKTQASEDVVAADDATVEDEQSEDIDMYFNQHYDGMLCTINYIYSKSLFSTLSADMNDQCTL